MKAREKLENLIGISFDDYPSSDYLPTEVSVPRWSNFPRFTFEKRMKEPLYGIFSLINIVVMEHDYNKNIVFIAPDFRLMQISILERLLDELVEILGADKKRMLYLIEREYEELEQNTWEGRDWNFPAYLDRPDVLLYFKPEEGLVLTIFEPVNLFEDEEDLDED